MYFDSAEQIAEIAATSGTSIFVLPDNTPVHLPHAIVVQPEDKPTISIEQVRRATAGLGLRQDHDRFVIIRPADKLSEPAANAFLKNLEEPGSKVHFVLITAQPSQLLPTIRSRAAVYYWRDHTGYDLHINASDADKATAKRLIAATPADLVSIADSIAKKKDKKSAALSILGLTIEMLEKSYFITGKEVFARKLPKYLTAYDNISRNGHVKLHLIADLC